MNKIDFAVIFTVKNANPNGDPLNGNRPRQTLDGLGEMSDVSIKRKLRNRLLDTGENIFVQSEDKTVDGYNSLKERFDGELDAKKAAPEDIYNQACQKWFDVRAFGQVFTFKGESKGDGLSLGIRGAVAVQPAFTVHPVDITTTKITKSVNLTTSNSMTSDRMGDKHRLDFGVFVCYGTINSQLAEKNGFTEEDADTLKAALQSIFENDNSSARPEGSMEVRQVYWWKHNCPSGQYSSAKVHRSLQVVPLHDDVKKFEDVEITLEKLDGLEVEVLEGY